YFCIRSGRMPSDENNNNLPACGAPLAFASCAGPETKSTADAAVRAIAVPAARQLWSLISAPASSGCAHEPATTSRPAIDDNAYLYLNVISLSLRLCQDPFTEDARHLTLLGVGRGISHYPPAGPLRPLSPGRHVSPASSMGPPCGVFCHGGLAPNRMMTAGI